MADRLPPITRIQDGAQALLAVAILLEEQRPGADVSADRLYYLLHVIHDHIDDAARELPQA